MALYRASVGEIWEVREQPFFQGPVYMDVIFVYTANVKFNLNPFNSFGDKTGRLTYAISSIFSYLIPFVQRKRYA
jgi:hypothetical protein